MPFQSEREVGPLEQARILGRLQGAGDLAGDTWEPERVLGRLLRNVGAQIADRSTLLSEVRSGICESLTQGGAPDRQDAARRALLRSASVAAVEARLGWKAASKLASCWLEKIAGETDETLRNLATLLVAAPRPVKGEREFQALLARARAETPVDGDGRTESPDPALPPEVGREVNRLLDRSNALLRAYEAPWRAVLVALEPVPMARVGLPSVLSLPPTVGGRPGDEGSWPFRIGGAFSTGDGEPIPKNNTPAPAARALARFREILEVLIPTLPDPLRRHVLAPA